MQQRNKSYQANTKGIDWEEINYPKLETSYLLKNDNKCIFSNCFIFIIYIR